MKELEKLREEKRTIEHQIATLERQERHMKPYKALPADIRASKEQSSWLRPRSILLSFLVTCAIVAAGGFWLLDRFRLQTANKAGFSSYEELEHYRSHGIETMQQLQATGFASLEEYSEYTAYGFATLAEFERSGFDDLGQASILQKYGKTFDEALVNAAQISFNDFTTCAEKRGEYYKNYCYGKTGVFFAFVKGSNSYGVSLDLTDDCNRFGANVENVDAVNLTYEFSIEHVGKCIKTIAVVGLENVFTPDVSVEYVLWIETEQEKNTRIQNIKEREKREKLAEERKKLQELEANKFNSVWLYDQYEREAKSACWKEISKLINGPYGSKYRWINTSEYHFRYAGSASGNEPYSFRLYGNGIVSENMYGKTEKKSYACDFNAKTGEAVPIWY